MGRTIHEHEYAALAEVRYLIRQYLQGSDRAAEAAGVEPQQYQMLLAIRGLPDRDGASIRRLAERLLLRHHSAVGLIDRLEARGYVRRKASDRDRRQLCVVLLPRGQRALERVVKERLHELRESGHALILALSAILKHAESARLRQKTSGGSEHNKKKRFVLEERLSRRSAA
ncbi:MAG: MarR family transcriptional regulator [Candidatus Acidiferrum sp.]